MPAEPLKILIAALGSHGDIHPFLALAKALKQRGHAVSFIAPAMYEGLCGALSIDFVPIGTVEQFESISSRADLWEATKAIKVIAEAVDPMTGLFYQAIADRLDPGRTIVIHSTLVFGARVAQEKFDIPTVTVHLSPAIIRSVINPPYLPPLPLAAWEPAWFKRLVFNLGDKLLIDPLFAKSLNTFRKSVGLGPVDRIFRDWLNSPDRVIGLFPDWYAPPPPDWPRQLILGGFPLYDEADVTPMDPGLQRFLDAGQAPIAFTPGSAMQHGQKFFETAISTCRMLGRRGILLSRHAHTIPQDLPDQVRYVAYAPFGQLLPRCAALVHHGGIGTSAQGLAAGIPQLVMPMAHDQPDNGRRLERLGVAKAIPAAKFNAERAAAALAQMMHSAEVAESGRKVRARIASDNSLGRTVESIETVQRAR